MLSRRYYSFFFPLRATRGAPCPSLLLPRWCWTSVEHKKMRVCGIGSYGSRTSKIRAVAHFPQPRTPKKLQSFLGLCSYFRRSARGFGTIAAPLHQLLQKHSQFLWTEDCALAFNSLRQALTTAPVLSPFDPSAFTSIHTDASGYGLGAVLLQRHHKSPSDQVIAYASRTLTTPEKNYSTTERECLAVVWVVTKFRPYLFGPLRVHLSNRNHQREHPRHT